MKNVYEGSVGFKEEVVFGVACDGDSPVLQITSKEGTINLKVELAEGDLEKMIEVLQTVATYPAFLEEVRSLDAHADDCPCDYCAA